MAFAGEGLGAVAGVDGAGKDRRWTWDRVIERLKGIRIQSLYVGGTEIPEAISRPDEEQRRILELRKVKL